MKTLIQKLHAAQTVLVDRPASATVRRATIDRLRADIPPPILAHFLRMAEHGQRGVALVRHGVCSNCHIRVPSAVLPALVKPHDVHLCDQCGCYLLLPEDEAPPLLVRQTPAPRRLGKVTVA